MAKSSVQNLEETGYWQDRKVLVTGAGGFVASWICRELVERGAVVVGIVRDSPGERLLDLQGIHNNVQLVHGSISDYALVERALNEYEADVCLHLAAQAIVVAANRSPLSTFESNIKGTWNVLEACRRTPTLEAVIVASSDKAYGNQTELPYHEESPLNGRFPYDVSKVCVDVLSQSYALTYGLPVAITRCANIYGGGDLNWSRLIPGTIRSALRGEAPLIRSDGTMERDYVYVEDAARAYLGLAQRASEEGIRGQAFNFGSGDPISVLDLVDRIRDLAGSAVEPIVLGEAEAEIDRQFLDSSKAEEVLGWRPRVSMEEGLRRTIGWYASYLKQPVELAAVGG